jgi:HK97 family phage major capsid protein
MTKEQYLEKRNALLAEAQAFLNEGKLDEYRAKEQEIKDLDNQFDEIAKAQANMNALKGNAVVTDVTNLGVQPSGTTSSGQVATLAPQVTNEQEQYRIAFAKTMMGQKLTTEEQTLVDKVNAEFRKSNASVTQTAANHAILIPETVRDQIWKEIGEAHPILGDLGQGAFTFVPGDLTIIKETASGDDADWYDEETEVESDDTAFGELNLTGCELAKAITVSWKMKKMSIDAFLTYIVNKISEKMGNAIAKAAIEGKGKPGTGDTFKAQMKGIAVTLRAETNTPQIETYVVSTGPTYDDLVDWFARIKSGYLNGSSIYAKNVDIWGKLAKIKDNDGRPMFVTDPTSGGVGRILGVLVKEEDGVSAGEFLLGNVAKGYAVNVNENMTMYQEDHVKPRTTDYMGYAIIDGDVVTTKAFALLKAAAG